MAARNRLRCLEVAKPLADIFSTLGKARSGILPLRPTEAATAEVGYRACGGGPKLTLTPYVGASCRTVGGRPQQVLAGAYRTSGEKWAPQTAPHRRRTMVMQHQQDPGRDDGGCLVTPTTKLPLQRCDPPPGDRRHSIAVLQ